MKTLTVRDVSDDTYETLKKLASINHRSMQEQIKAILDREVRLVTGSRYSKAREWRQRLADRGWGDIVADIRSERNR